MSLKNRFESAERERVIISPNDPVFLFTTDNLKDIFDKSRYEQALKDGKPVDEGIQEHLAKVLPPGSSILVSGQGDVLEVKGSPYSKYYNDGLYTINIGFKDREIPAQTNVQIPTKQRIIDSLTKLVGTPYLYGGCYDQGSEKLANYVVSQGLFKEEDKNNPDLYRIMKLAGLDCSGLLAQATNYAFLADTRTVFQFAERLNENCIVDIEGKNIDDIVNTLKPLDIIVYYGHMLISLPDDKIIQSAGFDKNAEVFSETTNHKGDPMDKYGRVVIDEAKPIIEGIMNVSERSPSNSWDYNDKNKFMIIRWHPESVG